MNGSEGYYGSARQGSGAAADEERKRSADVPFPLTPALSPRERENPRQRVGESGASGMIERRSSRLPLLWGCACPASPLLRPPIPKGLCPPAQGCEQRATLGELRREVPTPTGLRPPSLLNRRNPVGVDRARVTFPRVARCSQPWALSRNPVGIRLLKSSGGECSALGVRGERVGRLLLTNLILEPTICHNH